MQLAYPAETSPETVRTRSEFELFKGPWVSYTDQSGECTQHPRQHSSHPDPTTRGIWRHRHAARASSLARAMTLRKWGELAKLEVDFVDFRDCSPPIFANFQGENHDQLSFEVPCYSIFSDKPCHTRVSWFSSNVHGDPVGPMATTQALPAGWVTFWDQHQTPKKTWEIRENVVSVEAMKLCCFI